MKILIVNAGSSSLKYQLVDMDGEKLMAKGLVERIGIEGSKLTQKVNGQDVVAVDAAIIEAKQHKGEALCIVLDTVKGAGVKAFEEMESNHAPKFNTPELKKTAQDAVDALNAQVEKLEEEIA